MVEDSPDYLPPNSYAPARVIVGVDASAGVASQTDPLPVVLRITGPARSVMQNGKVLTTRIQGCVVNGAARGDLSSEKVYVKLARMTCDQPGGRVAVSEVKGFISFAGKSGVRGRVVSRSMIWEHLYDEHDENTSNVVDVYIRYLRNKIDRGFEPPLIMTRWGEGYLLRGEDQ